MNERQPVPAMETPREGGSVRAQSALGADRADLGGFKNVLLASMMTPEGEPFRWGEATSRAVGVLFRGGHVELTVRSRDSWFAVFAQSTVPAPRDQPATTADGTGPAPIAVSEPVCLPDEEGRLCLEISGASPGGQPALPASGLRVLVVALAAVYEERIVTPLLRRRRLLDRLAPVQRGLIPFLLSGESEVRVAELTGRSRHTIHDHTKKIYKRLGVHTRHDLVVLWNGLDTGTAGVPAPPPLSAR